MGVIQCTDTIAYLFLNQLPHTFCERTEVTNGSPFADTGSKSNGVSALICHLILKLPQSLVVDTFGIQYAKKSRKVSWVSLSRHWDEPIKAIFSQTAGPFAQMVGCASKALTKPV